MTVVALLLFHLSCWPLVTSQTFPHVFFMNQTLANHSYVDLSLVGDDISGSDSVQCVTDLNTCCSSNEGSHRGDWFFPDGTRLPFPGGGDIYESRGSQRVYLHHRNNASSPTGIYLCTVTIAVSRVRHTVYLGLYTGSGTSLLLHALIDYRVAIVRSC